MNSRRLICLPRLGAVYKHSERYHIEPWPYLNWITLITADAIAFGVGALSGRNTPESFRRRHPRDKLDHGAGSAEIFGAGSGG